MNNKGQGWEGIILGFLLLIVYAAMLLFAMPLYNKFLDSMLPTLNSMPNYNVFSALFVLAPILLGIFIIFYIVRLFTGQQRQA